MFDEDSQGICVCAEGENGQAESVATELKSLNLFTMVHPLDGNCIDKAGGGDEQTQVAIAIDRH